MLFCTLIELFCKFCDLLVAVVRLKSQKLIVMLHHQTFIRFI